MLSACLRFAVLLRRSCAHPPLPQHACRCPVFVPCVPSPVYTVSRLHTLCTYCAYSLYISSAHSMPGRTAAAPCWTRRVPGHASSVHIPLPWRRHARTAPCTLLLAAHSPGEPSPDSTDGLVEGITNIGIEDPNYISPTEYSGKLLPSDMGAKGGDKK